MEEPSGRDAVHSGSRGGVEIVIEGVEIDVAVAGLDDIAGSVGIPRRTRPPKTRAASIRRISGSTRSRTSSEPVDAYAVAFSRRSVSAVDGESNLDDECGRCLVQPVWRFPACHHHIGVIRGVRGRPDDAVVGERPTSRGPRAGRDRLIQEPGGEIMALGAPVTR